MGLRDLAIAETYRLGVYCQNVLHSRPFVVKFSKIENRLAVWNNKGKIPFDRESPVRIQEDLPRQLRDDARVLQRIARVANSNLKKYGKVRVKDYKLEFKGARYGIDSIKSLPPGSVL